MRCITLGIGGNEKINWFYVRAAFKWGRLSIVSNIMSNKLKGEEENTYKSMAYKPNVNV